MDLKLRSTTTCVANHSNILIFTPAVAFDFAKVLR